MKNKRIKRRIKVAISKDWFNNAKKGKKEVFPIQIKVFLTLELLKELSNLKEKLQKDLSNHLTIQTQEGLHNKLYH